MKAYVNKYGLRMRDLARLGRAYEALSYYRNSLALALAEVVGHPLRNDVANTIKAVELLINAPRAVKDDQCMLIRLTPNAVSDGKDPSGE